MKNFCKYSKACNNNNKLWNEMKWKKRNDKINIEINHIMNKVLVIYAKKYFKKV